MRRTLLALLALLAAPAAAQTGTVAGRVVEAGTGAPLPGASVRLIGTALGDAAGPDGRFAIAGVVSGVYEVEASSVGFRPARRPVTVAPGARVEVVLTLTEAVVETGEVVVAAARAPTATRTDAPLRLVPQAVSVVPARVMEARLAADAAEALRMVPGVAVSGREQPFAALTLRGFEAEQTSTFRRNGVEFAHYYDPLRPNVERVEVLRGPASVLFGRIEPGGVINLVTERPLARRRAEVEAEGDTWGRARLVADATGPLVPGGRLLGRVNAAGERVASWREGLGGYEAFAAPVVTWAPSPALRLTVETEHERARVASDPGLALLDTTANPLRTLAHPTRFFGEPGSDYDWRSDFASVSAEATLPRGWTARAVASAGGYAFERERVKLMGLAAPDSVERQFHVEGSAFRYLQAEAALAGGVRTGPLAHGLTLGVEASRLAAEVHNRAALTPQGDSLVFGTIAPVGLADPAPRGLPPAGNLVEYLFADGGGVNVGLYAQDRLTMDVGRGRAHLLAAARLSYVTAGAEWFALLQTDQSPAGLSERRVSVTALTPGLAAIYEPAGWLSVYASHGRSFNPVFQQVSETGEPFDPTRGVGTEAGVKVETRRLRASLAVYRLDKRGALSQRASGAYVQTGAQRSRGVELDALAEPVPGLTVAAAYAFTDAVVTADEVIAPGTRLPGAPRHAGSAWAERRLTAGRLAGLGLSAGVTAVGARQASLRNDLVLPAHATVDLGASFDAGRVRVQALLTNALDARYADGADRAPEAGGPVALVVAWPAPPRALRVRLTARL